MSAKAIPTRNETFVGNWAWLFPLTYLVHIAEEYWGGFPSWVARIWGGEISNANFLTWNGTAWALMTTGVALVLTTKSFRWLIVSFGTVVLINGSAHTIASVVTRSYSPGLISGLLLWVPLGLVTLRRAAKRVNRLGLVSGIVAGILMHAAVTLLALSSTLRSA